MTALIDKENRASESAAKTDAKQVGCSAVVGAYQLPKATPMLLLVRTDSSTRKNTRTAKVSPCQEGLVVPCPVNIIGDLRSRQRQTEFQDKVQIFSFADFEGLFEYMNAPSFRLNIERRKEKTLKDVHERFRSIVHNVVT
jgi:hypothetical protein